MDNSWPVPLTSTAVDRIAKLLDPEESEYGPMIYTEMVSFSLGILAKSRYWVVVFFANKFKA